MEWEVPPTAALPTAIFQPLSLLSRCQLLSRGPGGQNDRNQECRALTASPHALPGSPMAVSALNPTQEAWTVKFSIQILNENT